MHCGEGRGRQGHVLPWAGWLPQIGSRRLGSRGVGVGPLRVRRLLRKLSVGPATDPPNPSSQARGRADASLLTGRGSAVATGLPARAVSRTGPQDPRFPQSASPRSLGSVLAAPRHGAPTVIGAAPHPTDAAAWWLGKVALLCAQTGNRGSVQHQTICRCIRGRRRRQHPRLRHPCRVC